VGQYRTTIKSKAQVKKQHYRLRLFYDLSDRLRFLMNTIA